MMKYKTVYTKDRYPEKGGLYLTECGWAEYITGTNRFNHFQIMLNNKMEEIEQAEWWLEPIVVTINKQELAEYMHNVYEKIAKINGWNTQVDTKVDFDKLPPANKKTMIELAQLILIFLKKQ